MLWVGLTVLAVAAVMAANGRFSPTAFGGGIGLVVLWYLFERERPTPPATEEELSSLSESPSFKLIGPREQMKQIGVLFAAAVLAGCASFSGDTLEERSLISYFDRNGDGKVDFETHRHPGIADADWEFRDDDYNGRYERKILYGFAVTESAVDLPVPKGVKIKKSIRSTHH